MGEKNKAKSPVAGKSKSSDVRETVERCGRMAVESSRIDPMLYRKYDVKRGLRDLNGKGVLAGLTRIGEISATRKVAGEVVHAKGQLVYRGIDVGRLVKGFVDEKRMGFEETAYLLFFGRLPDADELHSFEKYLGIQRVLPPQFLRDAILKVPSRDLMNSMARSVLTLYAYDEQADDLSPTNILRQSLWLTSLFPVLAVYGYQTAQRYYNEGSLIIHSPRPDLGTAENFLHMLRPDSRYAELEARLLDLALVLHAEHGGGNNSSFTTHVVSSSGTDTYSVIAAALGALKGPRHGGANIMALRMFEDLKKEVRDWEDKDEIVAYLKRILNKEAFDRSGLIYGIGHAVYSLSDPRTVILKKYAIDLARAKGAQDEYALYERVEALAPRVIASHRKMYKGVSANVDFYSGFIYSLLEIPPTLFTPLFAMARIVGWCAHRIEELANSGKIVRPAYKSVAPRNKYVALNDR